MKNFTQKPGRLLLMAGLLLSGFAAAAENASIPFANMNSIRDWQPDGNQALYVQSVHRDWYRATLWAPCWNLDFAIGIGFVTDVIGKLDQFSSIVVEGERCQFKTFEKSDPPPPREKRKKAKDREVSVKSTDDVSADAGSDAEEIAARKRLEREDRD